MAFKKIEAPRPRWNEGVRNESVRLRHYKGLAPIVVIPADIAGSASITLYSHVDLMVDGDVHPVRLAIVCHGSDARVCKVPGSKHLVQVISKRLASCLPIMRSTDVPHSIDIVDGRHAVIVHVPEPPLPDIMANGTKAMEKQS